MEPAGPIADRAYAPKPGAPARPAIVREARQPLAGVENSTGETLLTQNRKHYQTFSAANVHLNEKPMRRSASSPR